MPNMILTLPTTPAGSALPIERSIDIGNLGTGTIEFNITPNMSWIQVTEATGSITGTEILPVVISADISGLPVGSHVGNVVFFPVNGTCASNAPFDIEIQLTLT